jgi:hypothetical protein
MRILLGDPAGDPDRILTQSPDPFKRGKVEISNGMAYNRTVKERREEYVFE